MTVEDVPGISSEMATLIRTLTHPQADQRYTSAREVAKALHHLPV
ncbi:hypothetical protein [Neosynechococcus sphagnicola]|nr:hypothetical protein [Neosynechococcus sphagnicola]